LRSSNNCRAPCATARTRSIFHQMRGSSRVTTGPTKAARCCREAVVVERDDALAWLRELIEWRRRQLQPMLQLLVQLELVPQSCVQPPPGHARTQAASPWQVCVHPDPSHVTSQIDPSSHVCVQPPPAHENSQLVPAGQVWMQLDCGQDSTRSDPPPASGRSLPPASGEPPPPPVVQPPPVQLKLQSAPGPQLCSQFPPEQVAMQSESASHVCVHPPPGHSNRQSAPSRHVCSQAPPEQLAPQSESLSQTWLQPPRSHVNAQSSSAGQNCGPLPEPEHAIAIHAAASKPARKASERIGRHRSRSCSIGDPPGVRPMPR